MDVVEEDQRLLFPQAAADLRLSRLADPVALVEGFEEELQEIGGRLMPRRHVDDAVGKRSGSRMMREVPEERGLADAGLAAGLDRQAGVEGRKSRGQLGSTIEKASNQLRAKENRRGPGTKVRAFGPGSLADDGAARVADLQDDSGQPPSAR